MTVIAGGATVTSASLSTFSKGKVHAHSSQSRDFSDCAVDATSLDLGTEPPLLALLAYSLALEALCNTSESRHEVT